MFTLTLTQASLTEAHFEYLSLPDKVFSYLMGSAKAAERVHFLYSLTFSFSLFFSGYNSHEYPAVTQHTSQKNPFCGGYNRTQHH